MYCFSCSKEVLGKYCANCGLENRRTVEDKQTSSSSSNNIPSFSEFLNERSRKRGNTKKTISMPKKKKIDAREVTESTIYASLGRFDDGIMKQERNSRLPVIVNVNWGAYDLKCAVFEKFNRYNKSVMGKEKTDYKLVYKNGDVIRTIPGTQTDFTVKKYKEDLGVGYSALVVYLVPYEVFSSDISDDESKSIIEQPSTEESQQRTPRSDSSTITSSGRKICVLCGRTYTDDHCLMCQQDQELAESLLNDAIDLPENLAEQAHNEDNPDDEVLVSKEVVMHRLHFFKELLELFLDPNILEYDLKLKVLDPRGKEEVGKGDGVMRDVICSFWQDFFTSCSLGADEAVPSVRHDMAKENWEAVGRILLYGFRVQYFPTRLSPTFLCSFLFGEDSLDDETIIKSFKRFITQEERESIEKFMSAADGDEDEEINEILMDTLSAFNTYTKPTRENLPTILKELGHQEVIQKPRYIANCFSRIFHEKTHPFTNKKTLFDMYELRTPTNRKVIKHMQPPTAMTDAQTACFNHLTRYVRSLSKDNLYKLLHFITGGDLIPENRIYVEFSEQSPRSPRARTCVPQLQISETYDCYNSLAEEFSNVLNNAESFRFSII